MKKNYLLVIFTFILFSCHKDESNQDLYDYSFFDKSELTINSQEGSYMKYGVIDTGENLVFEYRFDKYFENAKAMADAGYFETVRFEIDSDLDKFSYSDEELINIKAVLTKYCYCGFTPSDLKNGNPKGTISGEKISNNKWNININITFYGDEEKVINGSFTMH